MENNEPQEPASRFSLSTLLTVSVLVGLVGFGAGFAFEGSDLGLNRYTSQNEHLPENLNYDSVDKVYDLLRQNYAGELDEKLLLEGMKAGLVAGAGDPFSEYLNAESAAELEQSLEGEFSGIGAEIGIRNDQLVIIAPLEGTPASRAGLRAGDAILAIDGDDTARLSVHEAVTLIRGEEGTDVTLTIIRAGRSTEDVVVTRATIEIPSVRSELIEGEIGYIELLRFGSDSAAKFRQAASQMKNEGAKSIILDVRNNPGGYLDVAVTIASEFLETGEVVVEERRGDEPLATERAQKGGVLAGLPTVVLVNGGSASASEIIAGALQDHGVATIVGDQTFGKGSVQQLFEIGGGDILRITIANWFTPSGTSINQKGITPDEEVELTDEDFERGRDPQLKRAVELLL